MVGRLLCSVASFMVYGAAMTVFSPIATLVTGDAAGSQFNNSASSAVTVPVTFSIVNGLNGLLTLVLLAALVLIWYRPVVKFIADVTAEHERSNRDTY
jgi:hypothetical protein